MTATDLATLIATHKGQRSYDRLSLDCGGTPTSARLHQLSSKAPKNFPDPLTIKGLAKGLGTTVTEVVAASASSLGLDVHFGTDPSALTIGDVGALPDGARDAIAAVAREMLKLHRAADQGEAGEEREDSSAPMNPAGESPAQVDLVHTGGGEFVLAETSAQDDYAWAARKGAPNAAPDTTTGEESQDDGTSDHPA